MAHVFGYTIINDVTRRSRGDNVTPGEGDALRDSLDESRDIEDQIRRRRPLPDLAIDATGQRQVRAVDLVGGHDPGSHRSERIDTFA
jgi:hypothetical protein